MALIIIRTFIHYFLHFILPFFVAKWINPLEWKKNLFALWLTMLIDLDHLWATPVFDACRCSVGFHTFHTWPFIGLYFVLLFYKNSRIFGVGLLLHIITDSIDCAFSSFLC